MDGSWWYRFVRVSSRSLTHSHSLSMRKHITMRLETRLSIFFHPTFFAHSCKNHNKNLMKSKQYARSRSSHTYAPLSFHIKQHICGCSHTKKEERIFGFVYDSFRHATFFSIYSFCVCFERIFLERNSGDLTFA